MFKTIVLIIFVFVLVIDFMFELVKEKINIFDLILRAFMVVSFCFLSLSF